VCFSTKITKCYTWKWWHNNGIENIKLRFETLLRGPFSYEYGKITELRTVFQNSKSTAVVGVLLLPVLSTSTVPVVVTVSSTLTTSSGELEHGSTLESGVVLLL
jgi:hypothetical protein